MLRNIHSYYGPTANVWIYPKGYKNIEASSDSDMSDHYGAKTRKGGDGLETVLQLLPIDLLDSIEHEDWAAVKALILADKTVVNFRSREGETPLIKLARGGKYAGPVEEMFQLLVEAGVEVNARD